MKESDMPFIHNGLKETNWQDVPDCQKQLANRAECDKRVIEDFNFFLKTERYKFRVFVAEMDNAPVGYISIGELSNQLIGLPIGSLLDLWVDPEFRNKGIGNELFDHAMNELIDNGYTHFGGLVSASNKASFHMCEKRDFLPGHISLYKQIDGESK
ncbi:MAG: GNAT family N-acetyltransferase [Thermoplasmata archaeon]|nr:GNAT family N-acetyltransferase [Thermoplasmata archaeon]